MTKRITFICDECEGEETFDVVSGAQMPESPYTFGILSMGIELRFCGAECFWSWAERSQRIVGRVPA